MHQHAFTYVALYILPTIINNRMRRYEEATMRSMSEIYDQCRQIGLTDSQRVQQHVGAGGYWFSSNDATARTTAEHRGTVDRAQLI